MIYLRASLISLLVSSLSSGNVAAFSVPRLAQPTRSRTTLIRATPDLHEFDFILQETATPPTAPTSRRRIALTGADSRQTVLASSFAGPSTTIQQDAAEDDPYADTVDTQLEKVQQFQMQQQQGGGITSKFQKMDLQDIIITLIVPSVALFAAGRWGYNRIAVRVQDKLDVLLDGFAKEMIYHDGDFKEMELCVADYSGRLVWLGPTKTDAMLKRYLEAYAKKKTISPQAVASLSYVFNIFKLSEAKAAAILVSLCKQMGTEKISSAGKLLFLGSRILKSPEGVAALKPIKELIMSTYRDAQVAEMLVETSQQAIAEAAYRAAVQAGGKDQKKLTVGWEVLGLDRDTATRIFNDEAKEGFVSDRVTMYGLQNQKYDKHGNRIDKYSDPKASDDDDDYPEPEEEFPISNVYECGECGFTLFIAEGRESKFFGENFRCPDCGAKKDKFIAKTE